MLDYVPEDMVASVQCGITLDALAGRLGQHGQRLPLDPAPGGGRSVGGVLATAASGPLRLRYGTGRDLLLGVRFVQADGVITWGGARVVKSVTGYDVPKLLVGSLGTLGVLAEATVRLHPIAPAWGAWVWAFDAIPAAAAFLAAVVDSAIQPERMVLLDAGAMRATGETGASGRESAVAISVASAAEAVSAQREALTALATRHGGRMREIGAGAWSRLGAALAGPIVIRLAGEPARLGHWLAALEHVARDGEDRRGLRRRGRRRRPPRLASRARGRRAPRRDLARGCGVGAARGAGARGGQPGRGARAARGEGHRGRLGPRRARGAGHHAPSQERVRPRGDSQSRPLRGRLVSLQSPEFLDGLRACVHCGICLPQCPTYRVLEEEMDSPRGRIYLMRAAAEGRTTLTPGLARHLDLCLGCRACETACPSGVPFGRLLETTRAELVRTRTQAPETDHALLGMLLAVFPRPQRLGALARALRAYQRSGFQATVRGLRLLAPFKRLRTLEALLPSLPSGTAASLPEVTPARGRRRGRVGLLTGCVQRVFYPHVNVQTARLLAAAGWEVVAPRGQGCCGALHLHAGRLDEFRGFARALRGGVPRRPRFPRRERRRLRLRPQGIRSLAARSDGVRGEGPRRDRGARGRHAPAR